MYDAGADVEYPPALAALGPVRQVAWVVDDLEQTLDAAQRRMPDRTWKVWNYGPKYLAWQYIGVEAAEFRFRVAVTSNVPQIEYIQPLSPNTSAYRQLKEQGESVHHLGYFVNNFRAASTTLQQLGLQAAESGGGHGLDGDGAFAYFDLRPSLGLFVEIIEVPARRGAPHGLRRPISA